jgi:CBS domain-containing protein
MKKGIEMNVCDVMTNEVETISAEDTLFLASQKMKRVDSGVLPVTTEDGAVVGVLSDRDLVVRAIAEGSDPKTTSVEDAMTREVVTCRPDCPVEDAASAMRLRQIRRLIVTKEHNQDVIGIVSLGDIAVRGDENELVGGATEGVCQPCE